MNNVDAIIWGPDAKSGYTKMTLCAYYIGKDGHFVGISDTILTSESTANPIRKPTFGLFRSEQEHTRTPVAYCQKTVVFDGTAISFSGDVQQGISYLYGVTERKESFNIHRLGLDMPMFANRQLDKLSVIALQKNNGAFTLSSFGNCSTYTGDGFQIRAIGSGSKHFIRSVLDVARLREMSLSSASECLHVFSVIAADHIHNEMNSQSIVHEHGYGGWFEFFGNLTGNFEKYDVAYGTWLSREEKGDIYNLCVICHKYLESSDCIVFSILNPSFSSLFSEQITNAQAREKAMEGLSPYFSIVRSVGYRDKSKSNTRIIRPHFDIEMHRSSSATLYTSGSTQITVLFHGRNSSGEVSNRIYLAKGKDYTESRQISEEFGFFEITTNVQHAKATLWLEQ